ncbi:efflux RND transporter permease subunit [Anaeromyxobacter diazotrophicus]|uniref:Exporter n=1 Tax=Anaeromyxobacter diazotrophicus TaxID=2590199 RepID=A0A7I9VQ08_9BACT|nr:MMPL family transporter [Anaeromyxobacter diazotrophicus]GEJ58441.1 exporter [Anaeromyxobacter diazotrophicus]
MRLDLVSRLTAASLRRWRVFLAGAVLASVASFWLASHLEIRSSFEELLPEDVPSVRHAKELARRVGGDGTILVEVESLDGPGGLARAEAMAVKLTEDFRALRPDVIRAVESDVRPVERWYTDHWPMFLPLDTLRQAQRDLVGALGSAKAKLNPAMNLLGEDEDALPAGELRLDLSRREGLGDLLDPTKPGPREQVAKRFERFADGFMVHPDRRSVTILLRPTGTSLGVGEVRVVLDRIRATIDRHQPELKADRLYVGVGGSYAILLAEYESIVKDAAISFAIVMALVLLSIVAFYREIRPVLALAGALLAGIAATFGLTWLVIGYLNTQTAFLGSIVVGTGVNYGIVYLARVSQLRRRGASLEEACQEGASAAVKGTLLASVGTSVAFGTLLVATNRGFRHFGFIGGVGVLLCWVATFALIPALLAALERLRPYRAPAAAASVDRGSLLIDRLLRRPRAIAAGFAVLTAASLAVFVWHLPNAMERNLDNLTNDATGGEELRRDHARAREALGTSVAGAIALLPTRDGADAYCDALRQRMKEQPRLAQLIESCETVATVIPSHQEEKLAILRDLGDRLTDRVLAHLPADQARRAREIRAQLAEQRLLGDDEGPPSLVDQYRERDGTVGRLAFVRARGDAKLELGPNLRAYAAGVRDVPVAGGKYDAAGADIVVADLLEDIERQGPRVTLLSFLCVCALVVVFFRTRARSALLLLSLGSGVALMAGFATVTGIKINFFNFIVFPITFGIAVDYGANVLSRMVSRRNVAPALKEVGGAVILCSWTTIVGYGSLILSFNRALRSFGWYAMLGELTTLVTAIVLLPALAKLFPGESWMARPGEAILGEDDPPAAADGDDRRAAG